MHSELNSIYREAKRKIGFQPAVDHRRAIDKRCRSMQRRTNMKCKLLFGITLAAASLLILPTLSSGAEDGAALYKKKCAGCHGASGEGKPAMKAPALKGTTQTPDQLTQHITTGEATAKAPHNKGISGVSEAQAK